jgi:hypothetical protein
MAKRKSSTFERLMSGKLNRKQRKAFVRRLSSDDPGLEIIHAHAAGIDVGNASHSGGGPGLALPFDLPRQDLAGIKRVVDSTLYRAR